MRKILVVEDAQSLRKDIVEMLGFEGFQAVGAENGIVGVQRARELLPDLIICDIMMPGLDGYGVLSELRHDSVTATIPFIFLTARTDRVDVRQGMELGADDFLTKPFHAAELLATVRARLDKRDLMNRANERRMDELRGNIMMALPHELRTPLNVMLGFSDLLMTDSAGMDSARIADMARHINNSALRLYRLIENFLLYAQTEVVMTDRGQIEEFRKRYTIYPHTIIAHHATQKARQLGRATDLDVHLAEVDAVAISEEFIKKMVEEVVDNACKFSPENSAILVDGKVDGAVYVLSVTDTGRGMTPEQIAKVGAYMQFERRIYEQQGIGLGLIICKRLADIHAGGFEIESVPAVKTVVTIKLPIKEDAEALRKTGR
ncbi:MAG: response regulator [Anaerolinea sp.]|nr:response regulator [Anaerolinea sp.]